ncbi:MAG TPA: M28 family peptidase [Prolixibacteraceae bacterium]|nr:M28 family peptidase [Prolixibacteraceae bacterium]HOR99471.1 M28 family peptidase [Prolixibacteraceae bacterium]HPL44614.1 M28 family peptidase [Prolixibacteraceae bacterium]
MYRKSLFLLLLAMMYGCNRASIVKPGDVIIYSNIEKHVRVLSDDNFRGRMPGSPEEPDIIGYIAGQMKEIGLEPANGGSYFQEVPMLKVTGASSPFLVFETPGGRVELEKQTDYVSFTRKMEELITLDASEVVFAGYGIVAPEYGRNDFEGIDVKGKTILVFVNDPGYGASGEYFKGNEMTYYGRWTYKFEEAARQGARACFIIHEAGPAGYGWNVVSNNGETTSLYLMPDNGYADRCGIEGWISLSSAERLFQACGMELSAVKEQARNPDFRSYILPVTATASLRNRFDSTVSNNVCGIIRGKSRPGEVVVYTAHWDHLGVGTPVDGDSIYNGATDNASAVSWLLEIARAFKSGDQPERSLLFLSPTGEESGLLGSSWYTGHPFFAMDSTVACINTDVILFLGAFRDVALTGYGYSDLDRLVEKVAASLGRYVVADPNPENGMFFRSDQFPFVKKGVPAIFAKGYTDAVKLGKDKTAEMIADYWKLVYHTPQDEYHPDRDDLTGLVDDARLFYLVGNELANATEWPAWNPGSEFGKLR